MITIRIRIIIIIIIYMKIIVIIIMIVNKPFPLLGRGCPFLFGFGVGPSFLLSGLLRVGIGPSVLGLWPTVINNNYKQNQYVLKNVMVEDKKIGVRPSAWGRPLAESNWNSKKRVSGSALPPWSRDWPRKASSIREMKFWAKFKTKNSKFNLVSGQETKL